MSERRSNGKSRSWVLILLFGIIATIAIFYSDSYTPLGFAHATLYIAPLLMVLTLGSRRLLYASVFLFTLLSVAGFFMSPNGIDREIATANRIASVAAMVVVVIAAIGIRDRR